MVLFKPVCVRACDICVCVGGFGWAGVGVCLIVKEREREKDMCVCVCVCARARARHICVCVYIRVYVCMYGNCSITATVILAESKCFIFTRLFSPHLTYVCRVCACLCPCVSVRMRIHMRVSYPQTSNFCVKHAHICIYRKHYQI
jgi:hypothetical protein